MKPTRVLLFLFSVLLTLVLVSLFFPGEGLRIGHGVVLSFPSIREHFPEVFSRGSLPAVSHGDVSAPDSLSADTVAMIVETRDVDTWPAVHFIDSSGLHLDRLLAHPRRIEYPDTTFRVMRSFFPSLYRLSKGRGRARILHYGDSQIEGDRITSHLRHMLQQRFGGTGCGLFPVVQVVQDGVSLRFTHSDHWDRFTWRHYRDSVIDHNRFGLLHSYCSFHLDKKDAWASLRVRKAPSALSGALHYKRGRVFYGQVTAPLYMEVQQNETLCFRDSIIPSPGFRETRWNSPPAAIRDLEIRFSSTAAPEIYGITLEDTAGIMVDNIPLRGSAGLEFSKIDPDLFRSMANALDVKLMILQFGVNVVPGETADFRWYTKGFHWQLAYLRQLLPGIDLLVVGVNDMGRRMDGKVVSYDNVEKVRDALKDAALRAGVPFWDTYLAMGGKNSMQHWVHHDPSLARPDYTHFSFMGSKIIATLLHDAMMADYRDYAAGLDSLQIVPARTNDSPGKTY